jgi:hypothetical protein
MSTTIDSKYSFPNSLNRWRRESATSNRRFLCSSVRHSGTQRAHTLWYPCSMDKILCTLPMNSSNAVDKYLIVAGRLSNQFLHSYFLHTGPWHAWPTDAIMYVRYTTFEHSATFSHTLHSPHAIPIHLYQLAVDFEGDISFTPHLPPKKNQTTPRSFHRSELSMSLQLCINLPHEQHLIHSCAISCMLTLWQVVACYQKIKYLINLLKPSCNFTYHHVQHSRILHGAHAMFMCFVWVSEKPATFTLYIINWLVFITEVESAYSAVRAESLYKTDYLSSSKG